MHSLWRCLGIREINNLKLYEASQEVLKQYERVRDLGVPLPESLEKLLRTLANTFQTLPEGQCLIFESEEPRSFFDQLRSPSEASCPNLFTDAFYLTKCSKDLNRIGIPLPENLKMSLNSLSLEIDGSLVP